MKTYEDYMFSGPMTDGEEISSFFEELSSFSYGESKMRIYGFANEPGLFFLETPRETIDEETLVSKAGYEIKVDSEIISEINERFGDGFFETAEEEGVVVDILLKELGYVF